MNYKYPDANCTKEYLKALYEFLLNKSKKSDKISKNDRSFRPAEFQKENDNRFFLKELCMVLNHYIHRNCPDSIHIEYIEYFIDHVCTNNGVFSIDFPKTLKSEALCESIQNNFWYAYVTENKPYLEMFTGHSQSIKYIINNSTLPLENELQSNSSPSFLPHFSLINNKHRILIYIHKTRYKNEDQKKLFDLILSPTIFIPLILTVQNLLANDFWDIINHGQYRNTVYSDPDMSSHIKILDLPESQIRSFDSIMASTNIISYAKKFDSKLQLYTYSHQAGALKQLLASDNPLSLPRNYSYLRQNKFTKQDCHSYRRIKSIYTKCMPIDKYNNTKISDANTFFYFDDYFHFSIATELFCFLLEHNLDKSTDIISRLCTLLVELQRFTGCNISEVLSTWGPNRLMDLINCLEQNLEPIKKLMTIMASQFYNEYMHLLIHRNLDACLNNTDENKIIKIITKHFFETVLDSELEQNKRINFDYFNSKWNNYTKIYSTRIIQNISNQDFLNQTIEDLNNIKPSENNDEKRVAEDIKFLQNELNKQKLFDISINVKDIHDFTFKILTQMIKKAYLDTSDDSFNQILIELYEDNPIISQKALNKIDSLIPNNISRKDKKTELFKYIQGKLIQSNYQVQSLKTLYTTYSSTKSYVLDPNTSNPKN